MENRQYIYTYKVLLILAIILLAYFTTTPTLNSMLIANHTNKSFNCSSCMPYQSAYIHRRNHKLKDHTTLYKESIQAHCAKNMALKTIVYKKDVLKNIF